MYASTTILPISLSPSPNLCLIFIPLACYLRPQFLENRPCPPGMADSSSSPPDTQFRGDDCDYPQLISAHLRCLTSYLSSSPINPLQLADFGFSKTASFLLLSSYLESLSTFLFLPTLPPPSSQSCRLLHPPLRPRRPMALCCLPAPHRASSMAAKAALALAPPLDSSDSLTTSTSITSSGLLCGNPPRSLLTWAFLEPPVPRTAFSLRRIRATLPLPLRASRSRWSKVRQLLSRSIGVELQR